MISNPILENRIRFVRIMSSQSNFGSFDNKVFEQALKEAIIQKAPEIAALLSKVIFPGTISKSKTISKNMSLPQKAPKKTSDTEDKFLEKLKTGISKAESNGKVYNVSSGRQITDSESMRKQYVFHDEYGIAGKEGCSKLAQALELLKTGTPQKTPKSKKKPQKKKNNFSVERIKNTQYFLNNKTNLVLEPRVGAGPRGKETYVVVGVFEDEEIKPLTSEAMETAKKYKMDYDENVLSPPPSDDEENDTNFCPFCAEQVDCLNEDGICITTDERDGCDKCQDCKQTTMKVENDELYCPECYFAEEESLKATKQEFQKYNKRLISGEDCEDAGKVSKKLKIPEDKVQDIIENYDQYCKKYDMVDDEDEDDDVTGQTTSIIESMIL